MSGWLLVIFLLSFFSSTVHIQQMDFDRSFSSRFSEVTFVLHHENLSFLSA